MELHLTATECHLSYGITQCYLPPDTSEHPALPQPGRYSIYLPPWDKRLSWPMYILSVLAWRYFVTVTPGVWPNNGWLLRDSTLQSQWGSRGLPPRIRRLCLSDQFWTHLTTSDHCCMSERTQDLFPLRHPTYHPASTACTWNERGLTLCH